MNREEYCAAAYDMLRLIRDSITGVVPDKQKTNQIDLNNLAKVSMKHGLAAMTAYALEYQGVRQAEFDELYAKAQRRHVIFESEYKKISDTLNQNRIHHMPLKGMVIKSLYPAAGLREMVDMDVFINEAYALKVRHIMSGMGYEIKEFGESKHDVYFKPPIICCEMHRSMISTDSLPKLAKMYQAKTNRLIEESDSFCLSQTHEESYLYAIVHAYKHYEQAGVGLRFLIDIYLMLKYWRDDMDMAYIDAECKKMEISGFESEFRTLAINVFSAVQLTEAEKILLEEVLLSGLYGSREQYYHKAIKKTLKQSARGGKLTYLKERMKLPTKKLEAHPFISRHRSLIVLPTAARLITAPFKRRKAVVKELKSLMRYKDNKE